MGGLGSGRKPDPVKQLIGFNQPVKSEVSDVLYLPNYSGVRDSARKDRPEVSTAETDPLSLHLDQTTPQTIINGLPNFSEGITLGKTKWDENFMDYSSSDMGFFLQRANVLIAPQETETNYFYPSEVIHDFDGIAIFGAGKSDAFAPSPEEITTYVTKDELTTNKLVIRNAYTLPTADGSDGQAMITDGDGNVSWGDFLKLDQTTPQTIINGAPIIEQTTPYALRLNNTGANTYQLDFTTGETSSGYIYGKDGVEQSRFVYSYQNNRIEIGTFAGGGNVLVNDNLLVQGAISMYDVGLETAIYTLPITDGSDGQVLTTDGAGVVSWQDETDPLSLHLDQTTPQTVANGAPYFSTAIKTPKIYPNANSTTALQFLKADGTTAVVTIDTINSGVGIGTTNIDTKLTIAQSADRDGIKITGYDDMSSYYVKLSVDSYGVARFDANDAFKVASSYTWFAPNEVSASGFNLFSVGSATGYTEFRNGAGNSAMRINVAGNVGIGTTTISAKTHIISTTEQLRLGYDTSNYKSETISSTGSCTTALTGTSPKNIFSQAIRANGGYESSDGSAGLSATYNFDATTPGNITSMTFKNGILTAVTTLP